jgi:MoxR-like ATPase
LIVLQGVVDAVYVDPALMEYAVKLVRATRHPETVGHPEVNRLIEFGASPRASINLILAGRALAFLRGREYALPQDVHDLALDIIRHRLVLSYEALASNVSADDVLQQLVPAVPMPEVSLAENNRGTRVFAGR